ncbi:UNVERIFIED_CONTAM: hypothetical protein GTU68_009071 [Idotea baltica]|nr:hypothetical protein [Idotea baltica]
MQAHQKRKQASFRKQPQSQQMRLKQWRLIPNWSKPAKRYFANAKHATKWGRARKTALAHN